MVRVDFIAYEVVAERAGELRDNLTLHDAWYAAVAELLGAELATLDLRLARAAGPKCGFLLPPGQRS